MRILLKIIHNSTIALLWAFVVELAVHGFFGLQAFLLGGFLGEVALVKVFGRSRGVEIGAWSLGLLIFGMAFVSFVLGEYLKGHVQSFIWAGKGGQEYMDAFRDTIRLAIGMELTSLAFRVATVGIHEGDWVSASLIGIAGLIGLWYAIKMAKVIHASINRDPAYDLAASQDAAGIMLAHRAEKQIRHMTPSQLAGWADGDPSALEEAASSGFFSEQQKKASREARRQAKLTREQEEQEREEAGRTRFYENMKQKGNLFKGFRKQPTQPKADPSFPQAQAATQASRLSQSNGHHS